MRALNQGLQPCVAEPDAQLDAARDPDHLYLPTRYPIWLDTVTPGESFSRIQSERALACADAIVVAGQGSWAGASRPAAPARARAS